MEEALCGGQENRVQPCEQETDVDLKKKGGVHDGVLQYYS